MRRARLIPVLVVLALASSCARCGAPRGAPPERFVPSAAGGAVVIPEIAEASRQAAALLGALAARPGGDELGLLRSGLGSQLTFDLFDPESLRGAGLDVKRGLAMAELTAGPGQPGTPLLVLPIGDEAALDGQVTRLARERLGAADRGEQAAGGASFAVWRRAPGSVPLLSVAKAEGSMLVAIGPGGPDALRQVLALDPALSMAANPAWRRARGALGEGAPLIFYVPRTAASLAEYPGSDGLIAGLSTSATGLRLAVAVMLGAKEAEVRPLAGPGDGSSRPSRLHPATVLAARLSADPAAVIRLAAGQRPVPYLEPATAMAAQLATPIEVGASLSPRPDLAGLMGGRILSEPFTVVRLEALAGLKDPAAFTAACDRLLAAVGARAGTPGTGRWSLRDRDAELAWAVQGQTVALVAGVGDGLAALLARLAGGGPGFEPPAATSGALAGGLGGLVLHGDNLAAALQAVPASAYGAGPDAVVGRSMVEKAVSSLGRGAAVALRADLPAGALKLTLDLKLGAPDAAPR